MRKETILVVDDDVKIAEMLRRSLEYEGYHVLIAHHGEDALIYFLQHNVDLLILDVMLPGLSGWDICKEIRAISNVPIIMLTAKDDVEDRVKGLDAGADDYVVKPFALVELLARIRANLRRLPTIEATDLSFSYADIELYPDRRECLRGGISLNLKGKEFDLLELFMKHPLQVLSKEQILTQLWGYDYEGASNVVEVYIAGLRAKLEAHGGQRIIHTIRGVGYQLKEVC
jgi:two-component system response regulator MprA